MQKLQHLTVLCLTPQLILRLQNASTLCCFTLCFLCSLFSVFLFLSFSDIVENAQIPLCLSHKFGCTAYWAPHDLLPPVPFNSYLFYGHIYYSFYAETMQMEFLEYLEILSIMQDIGGILYWIFASGWRMEDETTLGSIGTTSSVWALWVFHGSGVGEDMQVEVVWGWVGVGEVWR